SPGCRPIRSRAAGSPRAGGTWAAGAKRPGAVRAGCRCSRRAGKLRDEVETVVRIYTRTGDQGQTALLGGDRVAKDDLRVEAYGTVDELNAVLGLARAACGDPSLDAALARIQHELFELGADLADPRGTTRRPGLGDAHVEALEAEIDRFTAEVPPLRRFVLPGGGELGARLHLARTVARRAE